MLQRRTLIRAYLHGDLVKRMTQTHKKNNLKVVGDLFALLLLRNSCCHNRRALPGMSLKDDADPMHGTSVSARTYN